MLNAKVGNHFRNESYAHTGLRIVWCGLPRAPLADSLCPGLTSGCAFGARKEAMPTLCGRGRSGVAAPRSPAPSGTPPCTLFETPASVGTPEYPEWIWTAISQGAGNEMVTCVESASHRVVLAVGADAEWDVRPLMTAIALSWPSSAPVAERWHGRGRGVVGRGSSSAGFCHPGVEDIMLDHPGVSLRATPGYSDGIPPGCASRGTAELPESGSDFVTQDIRGEWLMLWDCPEIDGGKAEG